MKKISFTPQDVRFIPLGVCGLNLTRGHESQNKSLYVIYYNDK